jgi:hypothetical protein
MTKNALVELLEREGAIVEYDYNICGYTRCTLPSKVVVEIGTDLVTISNPAITFPLEPAMFCDEPQNWINNSVILVMTCNGCYFTIQLK